MNEIQSIIHRAESGFLYPQDQKVVWAALMSAAKASTSQSNRDVSTFLTVHLSNGLNHTRRMKVIQEHNED